MALAAVALAACGRAPDFWVHGAAVYVETDAPFARAPDVQQRVETTVDAALRYFGGDWSALAGRSLTLEGTPYVACDGASGALGCWDGAIRVTTRDPGTGTVACVEETVLVHEVGHAVLGDRLHEDPRWMDLRPVAEALAGRAGYGRDGPVPCTIYPSVWRHPLGSP